MTVKVVHMRSNHSDYGSSCNSCGESSEFIVTLNTLSFRLCIECMAHLKKSIAALMKYPKGKPSPARVE